MRVQRIEELGEEAWTSVGQVLGEADEEFYPPLSSRLDTRSLENLPRTRSLDRYVTALRAESVLVARLEGTTVGMLSYLAGFRSDEFTAWSPSAYVTTIAVLRPWRGRGVGRGLYVALAAEARSAGLCYVTTRTWGTNHAHLELLRALEFVEVYRVVDDRGASVDTVGLGLSLAAAAPRLASADSPR